MTPSGYVLAIVGMLVVVGTLNWLATRAEVAAPILCAASLAVAIVAPTLLTSETYLYGLTSLVWVVSAANAVHQLKVDTLGRH